MKVRHKKIRKAAGYAACIAQQAMLCSNAVYIHADAQCSAYICSAVAIVAVNRAMAIVAVKNASSWASIATAIAIVALEDAATKACNAMADIVAKSTAQKAREQYGEALLTLNTFDEQKFELSKQIMQDGQLYRQQPELSVVKQMRSTINFNGDRQLNVSLAFVKTLQPRIKATARCHRAFLSPNWLEDVLYLRDWLQRVLVGGFSDVIRSTPFDEAGYGYSKHKFPADPCDPFAVRPPYPRLESAHQGTVLGGGASWHTHDHGANWQYGKPAATPRHRKEPEGGRNKIHSRVIHSKYIN